MESLIEQSPAIAYGILFLAGCVAGFINTLSGGGSLLTLPLLMEFLPSTAVANASNRLGILTGGLSAASGFKSKNISPWPEAFVLGIPATIGAVIGAQISVVIDDDLFRKIVAVVMILALYTVIRKPKAADLEGTLKKPYYISVPVFFLIGLYGGFLQAGVGFLIIAALVGIHKLGFVRTNSIKVVVALIYTVFALGLFIFQGKMHWPSAIALAGGQLVSGWVTSRYSVKKGERIIRPIVICMILVMAVRIWLK